ncbi:MAG: TIGR01212 family radical SAM protein [Lachnospiraceae bacterium]|nr:TIGR01212 family radical SAM protein [Lachnospiraceae bacterium]
MNYYSFNDYCRDTFGEKVYKVSINAGFTCPNRDGTLDSRGCIFCSAKGSGDFAQSSLLSVTEQIEKGKERVSSKIGPNGKYIAYFQSFTNTYAPVDTLRSLYTEALNHPDIVALSIATRPDCLSKEVLDLLSECNKIKPVWVELGLQTIHEKTAEYIRRCYPLSVYDEAVNALRERNLYTIVHVILGLPGESGEDILKTVDYVGKSKVGGIKLQLLHVLRNTDLAADYAAGKFKCLSLEEYADLVADCIAILPSDLVIHRITGDGDKKLLIAPLWSADKKHVLNTLKKVISER